MKAFTIVFLSTFSSVLAYEPCNFTTEIIMSEKNHVFNDFVDGTAAFLFISDQDNCSVNVDDIYEQVNRKIVEKDYNKTEVVIEFNFVSDLNTLINFLSNRANVSENVKINVALGLKKCDVYLEEFEVFQKYGNIVSIIHDNESVIRLPYYVIKCPFAQQVSVISSRVSCNARNIKRFFWEACEEVFEKVVFLRLSACNDDHVFLETDTLVRSFPKVQSLELENIDLANQTIYPWTHSDCDFNDKLQFLLEGNGTVSTNSTTPPSLQINNSSSVIGMLLHLCGRIEKIVFNRVQFKENQGQIFANVTGLQRLDLSQNNLTEIDEQLFEHQFELSEIRLKQNKLTNLPARLFEQQFFLQYLDISENCLTSVDQNLLKNLFELQELHLEHNQLKFLPPRFLREQIYSLKYLYLHSNPIVTLPEMPFYGTNIVLIDLHSTEITGKGIENLTARLNFIDFSHALRKNTRSLLDLSSCKIKNIPFNSAEEAQRLNFIWLINFFDINMDGNPIFCNSDLYSTIKMMKTVQMDSGVFFNWKCDDPEELDERLLVNITKHDLKKQADLLDCPDMCSCYERLDLSSFIVDCRHTNLSVLPMKMPKNYPLELWLQNASLSVLHPRVYFENISVLDISNNTLTKIPGDVVNQLKSVNTLRLDNNKLASLPDEIKFMNISKITLDGNAFLCDCHTRWMLDWLLHDELCPVINKNILKCTDNNKHVKNVIQVPDSMFVCNEIITPSIAIHVIFPSIVIGSTLLVIVVLSLVIYFQRFTVKVLLYIICGFRGFVDKPEKQHGLRYDCAIIYAKGDPNFDDNRIATKLIDMGYRVADAYKHSVIGFTFFDGIHELIATSRRVIFFMTCNTIDNELMATLWNYTYSRAIKHDIASLILITDDEFKVKCSDENIKGYLKNGRYINVASRLLFKRIEYMMPARNIGETLAHWDTFVSHEYEMSCLRHKYIMKPETTVSVSDKKPDIYIVFPDELGNLIRHELIPFLLQNKQNACALEDDFMYGNDITEIIHEKLDGVKHVIFILSNQTLQTLQTDSYEGTQLGYILPNILNKAFVSHHNYLLLFTFGVIDVENIPKDLRKYVNTYITTSVNDVNFKERLLEALTYERKVMDSDEENVKPSDTYVDSEAVNLI